MHLMDIINNSAEVPEAPASLHCRATATSTTSSASTISTPPFPFDFPITLLTIADRLYLASYIHPPTADTAFPYYKSTSRNSPSKRSQKVRNEPAAAPTKTEREPPCYFTVDDTLLYNAFHHDFGPMHIGHLYRFALHFHDVLAAKENQHRPIVFWSRADPSST